MRQWNTATVLYYWKLLLGRRCEVRSLDEPLCVEQWEVIEMERIIKGCIYLKCFPLRILIGNGHDPLCL